ncbi:glycosyltransferase family 9 protein (plasmid) [Azospirillum sp. TSA2s]|uniref:glycosyltransferase family 9 protein n=1 Tax=Azospirillum sp. TSA2s TaxID=709810 RepID=UPI0010AAE01B|nr:glycosyltransferase family 9 protein [Azospirillum sp. TSA2s]QCG93017.1 glycosyltransferase family 9 protein [Azospirillum sp. TSA2s]
MTPPPLQPIADQLLAATRIALAGDREGALALALALCRTIPADAPGKGDAEHLRAALEAGALPLGMTALAQGRPPRLADATHHHRAGHSLLARLMYAAVLQAEPEHPDALHNAAILLIQDGRLLDGLEQLTLLAERHGITPAVATSLASVTKLWLDALDRAPDDPQHHVEAVAPLLSRLPAVPGAYTQLLLHFGNRAARLPKQGKHAEAVRFGGVALAFDPGRHDLWFNLGYATEMGGGFEDAAGLYRRAAAAAADASTRAYALLMLMHLMFRLGRWEAFETLLPHKYDYAPLHWWKSYLPVPIWDGTIRPGSRILINGESGFGDVIQCLRYAAYFHERGMTAYILCDRRMKSLCALGKGVAGAFTHGERIPAVDVRAQSFDLFYMLERDAQRTFHSAAYIDIARSPHQAPMLERKPGERLVGIKWTTTDPAKDIPLALFARLLVRPGIRLISLQPEPPDEAVELTVERPLDPWFADAEHSFTSTAWAIAQMDLVVTADSVIAHLAGAVGTTAWVALRAVPDCRWLVDRSDCPFYDSLTLFRQSQAGGWEAVVNAMASELHRRLDGDTSPLPPPVLSRASSVISSSGYA